MSDIRNLRVTHTVALLEVPMPVYAFIAGELRDAGYDHAFDDASGQGGFPAIDMGGIALVPKIEPANLAEYVVDTTGKTLTFLLNRALNTLEPMHQPAWAAPLTDYIQPGDTVTITIKRAAGG